jgi:4-amino-4-deoxy-L-arabinose transferase-like glycosyltransferase
MTQQQPRLRNRIRAAATAQGPIAAVLLFAAMLRLDGIGFGLPALNDPDEPLFVMLAVDMLQRGSFDPQWFGHPGTVTLYCLAIIIAVVGSVGWLAGQWADQAGFVAAVYADPAIVVLPARIFIAANGVACVWLTYLLGKRLWGKGAGLVAALILAVNSVHIGWSQVIRTDVQASLFMLLCTLQALAILREGKLRHYLLAGVFAGLACATKWPAAVVGLSPLAAAIWRNLTEREDRRLLLAVPLAALATLLIVSPYLLISYDLVLRDLAGEAREAHPGATGNGLLGNAAWYVSGPLATSFGIPGLLLAGFGAIGAVRHWDWRIAVLPGFAAFLLIISAQHVLWERWLIPVFPFLALGFAWSVGWIGGALSRRNAKTARLVQGAAVLALLVPALIASHARSAERHNDTRQLASEWVRRHVPPGSTILVEHAAIDLLHGPWKVTFPLGAAGCVDARAVLGAKIAPPEVEKVRHGRPVVDLGHVDIEAIPACRPDFAILTHLDRYEAERGRFPAAFRRYELLLSDARTRATFRPRPGETGGPVVHIIQF